jgi:phage-related holin
VGALGYIINEIISIVENCGRAGVPIPQQFLAALLSVQKMQPARKAKGAGAGDGQAAS